jgi:hypothetical protein
MYHHTKFVSVGQSVPPHSGCSLTITIWESQIHEQDAMLQDCESNNMCTMIDSVPNRGGTHCILWKKVCETVYQNHMVSFTDTMTIIQLNFNLTWTNTNIPSTKVSEKHEASIFSVEELALLPIWFTMVCCLAYSLTLKMEATCASKTRSDFQRAVQCWTLNNHRCENLKSHKRLKNLPNGSRCGVRFG